MVICWLICLFGVAVTLCTEVMVNLWAALIAFYYLTGGVWIGQIVFRWLLQEGCWTIVRWRFLLMRRIGGLNRYVCWKVGKFFQVIKILFTISGILFSWRDEAVLCWKKNSNWSNWIWKTGIRKNSQNLPAKILTIKDKIIAFDLKGETADLMEGELEEYHELSKELSSLSTTHSSICWQQSRALWLRERDANSKFFHGVMPSRRRGNAVSCFLVDKVLI